MKKGVEEGKEVRSGKASCLRV